MYTNITYLAQSYFHQDYQDEADEATEIVENFRDSEPAESVAALRAEITALLDAGTAEADLSRIWLDEAGAYYDPEYDEITAREWLLSIVEILDRKAPETGGGIPFKGTPRV